MSRFLSAKFRSLQPYTPGEQPKQRKFIKLNTNESPFPPSKVAQEKAKEALDRLQLYPDPECRVLTEKLAKIYGVKYENMLLTNGSDEILNFAFMAFCDKDTPIVFADITYGFYPVIADLNGIPYEEMPLKEDMTICVDDYIGIGKNIVIANPNAPTGIALPLSDIEKIVSSNPDNIVIIDEAYVDFGGESAVSLIEKYDNLIVTQTFSKSRSMAGARLGYGIANAALIADMNAVKYSTNPYNINAMTMAAGIGTAEDWEYTVNNCKIIMENREYFEDEIEKIGFEYLPSSTNFVFAKHPVISGQKVYDKLREKGILVRHFTKEKIKDYNRITIGTKEQMNALITALYEIVKEEGV